MAALGWEAEGLETDVVAAGLARRRARAVIHEAPLEALDLPAAACDLVTLLHVLEHVPDPRGTLAAVRRVLRPGGTLLLALPMSGGLEAALFGSAWYHLDLPRHLWGFTPHALTRLLEESGFAVGSVRYLRSCSRRKACAAPAPAGAAPGRGASGGSGRRAGHAGVRRPAQTLRAFGTDAARGDHGGGRGAAPEATP